MNLQTLPKKLPLWRHSSYPQAILHIDADAFFVSVEQALNPKLQGKPVVSGAERGVVIALSYEAKAFGIKRGMLLGEARRLCPRLIATSGDYESYGLFSRRMFEIIRRYTPQVEEYSIDEAFADLSGLKRLHRCSYAKIAERIKNEVEKELGITVSVGLSTSKSLAKLASKHRKPSGFVTVPGRRISEFLAQTPIDKVWGFGHNSVAVLKKHGIHTVLDFVNQPHDFAKRCFGKIGSELWQELSGQSVYNVDSTEKTTYQSISKFKTFAPVTKDGEYLFAQLLRNLERALQKMRRYNLATKRFVMTLRTQDFKNDSLEITLSRYSSAALDLVGPIKDNFDLLFKEGQAYRATGVVLCGLKADKELQLDIFEDPARMVKVKTLDTVLDKINQHYGQRTIHLAESLPAQTAPDERSKMLKERQQKVFKRDIKRRGFHFPVLQMKVV